MRFVIVTGVSGAGKSTVLKMLEDAHYFCVDNLPIPLVEKFASLMLEVQEEGVQNAALGIDARSGRSLEELTLVLDHMKEAGYDFEILFMDAEDSVLVKRYKETRRSHPLASNGRVDDGIRLERQKMDFLRRRADYIIDTSHLLTRELRQEIEKIFVNDEKFCNMMVTVLSFGFKYGIPADADLVFDVRFLPNPYYEDELRPLTGMDESVFNYVMDNETARIFANKLEDMTEFLIPKYAQEGKTSLVIAIGLMTEAEGKKILRMQTENEALARKSFTILQKTFNIESGVSCSPEGYTRRGNLYIISVIDEAVIEEILDSTKLAVLESGGEMLDVVNSIVYQRDCCKRAFVRGAFLSSGSISDPQKGYHFEIVCPNEKIGRRLQEMIRSFHIDAKIVLRKKSYVLYVKEGAQIVDMLAIMEANVALMDLENIRILKEMRNSVNRKVNCETANINKTVNAAVKQIEDIRLLEEKVGLDSLNEGLEEVARLRLQYPEATLKELGMMLNPQVGKSGVNHRLRKLSTLADDLRERKEESYYD